MKNKQTLKDRYSYDFSQNHTFKAEIPFNFYKLSQKTIYQNEKKGYGYLFAVKNRFIINKYFKFDIGNTIFYTNNTLIISMQAFTGTYPVFRHFSGKGNEVFIKFLGKYKTVKVNLGIFRKYLNENNTIVTDDEVNNKNIKYGFEASLSYNIF